MSLNINHFQYVYIQGWVQKAEQIFKCTSPSFIPHTCIHTYSTDRRMPVTATWRTILAPSDIFTIHFTIAIVCILAAWKPIHVFLWFTFLRWFIIRTQWRIYVALHHTRFILYHIQCRIVDKSTFCSLAQCWFQLWVNMCPSLMLVWFQTKLAKSARLLPSSFLSMSASSTSGSLRARWFLKKKKVLRVTIFPFVEFFCDPFSFSAFHCTAP